MMLSKQFLDKTHHLQQLGYISKESVQGFINAEDEVSLYNYVMAAYWLWQDDNRKVKRNLSNFDKNVEKVRDELLDEGWIKDYVSMVFKKCNTKIEALQEMRELGSLFKMLNITNQINEEVQNYYDR